MNILILSVCAFLRFLHLFIADFALSLTVAFIDRALIHLLMAVVLYRVVKFFVRHYRQGKHIEFAGIVTLAKTNLYFWAISFIGSTLDEVLLYKNIDLQSEIMIIEGVVLAAVIAIGIFRVKGQLWNTTTYLKLGK
jgi:hypothetical protein